MGKQPKINTDVEDPSKKRRLAYFAKERNTEAPRCSIWQYELSSFHARDTKLEIFLPKNQHTKRKLLNFENWCNEEVS